MAMIREKSMAKKQCDFQSPKDGRQYVLSTTS
jgi:hypothetical protein